MRDTLLFIILLSSCGISQKLGEGIHSITINQEKAYNESLKLRVLLLKAQESRCGCENTK